ncbi:MULTISPECIES: VWA domain-containing protein [unclassified Rhizobium]|uniref:VWA domain-containing protein n=1 Tax=unclassified Rhizobium TaxID=2613769 RepID=UPI000CDF4AB4|nr:MULTISPECIES: VWA domain-containing protein [Rhizobium]AVA26435.1 von Willebrand factor A domain/tetratricopeptide repeat-containing protein [Rhizobium sp. NXC24]UWU24080.1 VWA domain-containing protein [Rhizobium tropici]
MIEDFHFLRPWWLLALALPVALLWLSSRSGDARNRWKGIIAPHLLDSLVVRGSGGSRFRPSWLLAAAMAAAAIATSGPTWEREVPPFVENTAPLVIAVDLSVTMNAIDVTPSRLERTKLKIRDVIAERQGARTAVVAYAGTAHLVLPFTEDASLTETYTDALATRIMPVPGKDSTRPLQLAEELLSKEETTGTILFMTDGIEERAFEAFKRGAGSSIVVLGVGTAAGGPVKTPDGGFETDAGGGRIFAKLDIEGLKRLHTQTGTEVATITDDDTDVRWIMQRIRTNFEQKQAKEGDRWRDMGWWAVIPLVILYAASFRRGWVVRLAGIVLAARMVMPTEVDAGSLADMWLTSDQQGRLAYEHSDYAAASAHFLDPMWEGAALYRAGKYAEAVDAFAAVDTAESWYDQGNALLHLERFDEAVAAYKRALDGRKGWPDAQANLAIAEALLKAKQEKEQDEQGEPNEKPDQVQFDDKGKQGKQGRIDIAEQTSEMWMKNIQVSPADLMARKFSLETREKTP